MNRNVILIGSMLVLLAPTLLVAGCRRHATVPADDARDRTTALREGEMRRAAGDRQWHSFGEPVAYELEQVDVADVLARPAAYEGQTVELTGTVTEVCQESGCWLKLSDAEGRSEAVFVKFTCPIDGEFLIPKEAVGKPVVVQGQVTVEEISEDVARHYAEDGGHSPEQIEQIRGPQRMIRVMSPSARVAMN